MKPQDPRPYGPSSTTAMTRVVVVPSSDKTRHVLERSLRPDEVQLSHIDGCPFVRSTTKLVGQCRGDEAIRPGDRIYLVEEGHRVQRGTIGAAADTSGALSKALWDNDALRRVVDVQGLHTCDALAYQDMRKRLPALPATLTQPLFLTTSIGLLTELEAGKVKATIGITRLWCLGTTQVVKQKIAANDTANCTGTAKRQRLELDPMFMQGHKGYAVQKQLQEKAKDAMAVLDAAQKSRESRAQQLNKAQQQMESLAAHKKRLTSQLKNDDMLIVKNEKAAEETSSRLQKYVEGISQFVETAMSEAGLSAQQALDLS